MLDWAPRRPSRMTLAMAGDEAMRSLEGQGAADLLVEALHFFGEGIDFQQILDRNSQALGRDRLDHEIVGAGAHRLDDGLDRALRGLHDHRQVAANALHLFEKFEPVHAGHHEIEDDQLDLPPAGPSETSRPLTPPSALSIRSRTA